MRIVLFGGSGMVGSGALRECLLDPDVREVLAIGRTELDQRDPKLRQIVRTDLFDYEGIDLRGYDACLYCLGVSSAGMSEEQYHRVTYELTMAAANALLQQSPNAAFIFVSGAGTDSTEKGRAMWARVKGKAENALLAMPFEAAFMLRPGYIQPVHGAVSKTTSYRILYSMLGPLFPLMKRLAPNALTTTETLGRVMLEIAKHGAPKKVLEAADIEALATRSRG